MTRVADSALGPSVDVARDPLDEGRVPYAGCPLCGADSAWILGDAPSSTAHRSSPGLPRAIRWLQCDGCGHLFAHGHFTDEASRLLAAADDELEPLWDFTRRRVDAADLLDALAALRPGPRWLIAGVGDGALLATAVEYGHAVVGVDGRRRAVDALTRHGFDVRHRDFAPADSAGGGDAVDDGDRDLGAPFDVVALSDLLARHPFPRLLLGRARRTLRDGGLLVVAAPNADALAFRALDEAPRPNPHWTDLHRLHLFGRRRLFSLLEDLAFAPCGYLVDPTTPAGMVIIARRVERAA